VINDMLLDPNGNPMWCDSPDAFRRHILFLRETDPKRIRGCRVRYGWPFKFVSVEEYLSDLGEESG
jgi:hypothetical protein